MGGPVVDWDLDKLVEEYGAREKLTPEEDKQLEEDLVKYVNEFEIEELKEENEQLKEKVDELTSKAVEETNKKEKAEAEAEQGKEMIKMLERRLESMNVAKREVRREQRASRGAGWSRERCWNFSRPGGCRYGTACRYIHSGLEEGVRATTNNQQMEQGFWQPPAMVRGVRSTMAGASSTMVRGSSTMVVQQQQLPMWTMPMNQRTVTNQMNQMMNQMNQRLMPMMVYRHQMWPGPQ